jgi:hypothetical protein
MRHGTAYRWIAAAVIVAVGIGSTPALAESASATLAGRVLSAGSRAPLAGARVHVGEPRAQKHVVSGTTGADGSFEIAGLEPAAYDLAIESNGGLYVVGSPVRLAAGENRTVQLAVSSEAPGTPATDEDSKKKGAATWWNNPLTATLIVVGAAVIVGAIIGSATDETPASPSAP